MMDIVKIGKECNQPHFLNMKLFILMYSSILQPFVQSLRNDSQSNCQDVENELTYQTEDDEDAVNILTLAHGEKYEQMLIDSIQSIKHNQTLSGITQTLRVWVGRNHVSQAFRERCWQGVEIKYISYKWFSTLFDHHRSIAEEIQLARLILIPSLLPYWVKRIIIKDADQIMQKASMYDLNDFYEADLSYDEEDSSNPKISYSRVAVFGYTPY